MAGINDVTIQMQVNSEHFERLLAAEELGGKGLWALVDEMLDVARVVSRADGAKPTDIERLADIPNFQERLGPTGVSKLTIYELLDLIEDVGGNRYELGPLFEPPAQ